ncbi:MAG: hypothetical protein QOG26_1437 [Solirubrobacterales bacterium]|nr:hypothetical protein [Solirubrobacterales bacterium]
MPQGPPGNTPRSRSYSLAEASSIACIAAWVSNRRDEAAVRGRKGLVRPLGQGDEDRVAAVMVSRSFQARSRSEAVGQYSTARSPRSATAPVARSTLSVDRRDDVDALAAGSRLGEARRAPRRPADRAQPERPRPSSTPPPRPPRHRRGGSRSRLSCRGPLLAAVAQLPHGALARLLPTYHPAHPGYAPPAPRASAAQRRSQAPSAYSESEVADSAARIVAACLGAQEGLSSRPVVKSRVKTG